MDLGDKVQSELTETQTPSQSEPETQSSQTEQQQEQNDIQLEKEKTETKPQQQETQTQEPQETQEEKQEPQGEKQEQKKYWYEQISPQEFQRIKAKYWEETVPVVAKEIGMNETELVKMMLAIGVDSPDLITDLRKTIAEIDSKNKRVTEDNKALKPQKKTITTSNSNTIKGKSWYEIADMIKKQRGAI